MSVVEFQLQVSGGHGLGVERNQTGVNVRSHQDVMKQHVGHGAVISAAGDREST